MALQTTSSAPLVTPCPSDSASSFGSQTRLKNFVKDTNQFLREIKPPAVSNIGFTAMGIPFKARHIPGDNTSHLLIWGTLGYLPYTVSSQEKRRELIAILEATHRLRAVRFGVDQNMQILVVGEYNISLPPAPDYIFVPLVRFLEEAIPFIRLIGAYL